MAGSLLVAAGGGGDAIAAAILHSALHPDDPAPIIATYAWERLLIDPLPGPRTPSEFTNLISVGATNFRVGPLSQPVPPSGSTLPRLANGLDGQLMLLDPSGGANGMRAQLAELIEMFHCTDVEVVDVGGDALARGDEDGLRSPLADALTLAAAQALSVPTRLLVTGAGLDGELTPGEVALRVDELGGRTIAKISQEHIADFLEILEWHPSEVTALVAAAARGLRGSAEIRDSGLRVELTDTSADVIAIDATAVQSDSLARSLRDSRSLDEAETALHRVIGRCELEYERDKAGRTTNQRLAPHNSLDERTTEFQEAASKRGIDFVTFRRIAEAVGSPTEVDRIRQSLLTSWPEQYAPPLWRVRA
jgi:hypothetical protein